MAITRKGFSEDFEKEKLSWSRIVCGTGPDNWYTQLSTPFDFEDFEALWNLWKENFLGAG